jgi:hypothetical protein
MQDYEIGMEGMEQTDLNSEEFQQQFPDEPP